MRVIVVWVYIGVPLFLETATFLGPLTAQNTTPGHRPQKPARGGLGVLVQGLGKQGTLFTGQTNTTSAELHKSLAAKNNPNVRNKLQHPFVSQAHVLRGQPLECLLAVRHQRGRRLAAISLSA